MRSQFLLTLSIYPISVPAFNVAVTSGPSTSLWTGYSRDVFVNLSNLPYRDF